MAFRINQKENMARSDPVNISQESISEIEIDATNEYSENLLSNIENIDEIDTNDKKISLDSPFVEDPIAVIDEDDTDSFDISPDEVQEDLANLELEKLRRKVNALSSLINKNRDAKAFVQCLDSIFKLEVEFELAWNYVISKMKYDSMRGETAISINDAKLETIYKNLEKIRRVNVLLEMTRALGVPSLAEELQTILLNCEFDVSLQERKKNNKESKVIEKLEKLLAQYADKLNTINKL